jgi:hypothetical protein
MSSSQASQKNYPRTAVLNFSVEVELKPMPGESTATGGVKSLAAALESLGRSCKWRRHSSPSSPLI